MSFSSCSTLTSTTFHHPPSPSPSSYNSSFQHSLPPPPFYKLESSPVSASTTPRGTGYTSISSYGEHYTPPNLLPSPKYHHEIGTVASRVPIPFSSAQLVSSRVLQPSFELSFLIPSLIIFLVPRTRSVQHHLRVHYKPRHGRLFIFFTLRILQSCTFSLISNLLTLLQQKKTNPKTVLRSNQINSTQQTPTK